MSRWCAIAWDLTPYPHAYGETPADAWRAVDELARQLATEQGLDHPDPDEPYTFTLYPDGSWRISWNGQLVGCVREACRSA